MKARPGRGSGKVLLEIGESDSSLIDKAEAEQKSNSPFDIKKILVPIDFSETSKKALAYAIPFAQQFDSKLLLLHVVQVNYIGGEFGAVEYPIPEKELRVSAERELRKIVETAVANRVPYELIIRSGAPVYEIINAVRENEVDLLVITTHGYTGLKHVLLGSVAENIVRHAPCPVLTVREEEHEFVRK